MERCEQITIIKAYADWTSASRRHQHIETVMRVYCNVAAMALPSAQLYACASLFRWWAWTLSLPKGMPLYCAVWRGDCRLEFYLFETMHANVCVTNTNRRRKRNDSTDEWAWAYRKYLLERNNKKKTKTWTHDNYSQRCLFEESNVWLKPINEWKCMDLCLIHMFHHSTVALQRPKCKYFICFFSFQFASAQQTSSQFSSDNLNFK